MNDFSGVERKQGDTYPIRAQIKDGSGVVDMTGASDVRLAVSTRPTRAASAVAVAAVNGTVETGVNGWTSFAVPPALSGLTPGAYEAEITFTIGGDVFTTKTFPYVVERQLA